MSYVGERRLMGEYDLAREFLNYIKGRKKYFKEQEVW